MLIDKNTEHQIEQTHVNYVTLCLPTKTKREDTPSTSKKKQKQKKTGHMDHTSPFLKLKSVQYYFT